MNITFVGPAKTDDPKSFFYFPTSSAAGIIFHIVMVTGGLGLGVYALSSWLAGGESVARNNAFLAVLVIIAIELFLMFNKVQGWKKVEELFNVWAIEHHGLIPQQYEFGSRGFQNFVSMETGETIVKKVVESDFGIRMKISSYMRVTLEDKLPEDSK